MTEEPYFMKQPRGFRSIIIKRGPGTRPQSETFLAPCNEGERIKHSGLKNFL